jgi:hypothetical protein
VADYRFVTDWQFAAPVERVWHEIRLMDRWPEWWPFVVRVELLKQGDADDVGSVRRITWKTALPYTLTFDSELVSVDRFRRMEGRAFGELDGVGIWTFREDDGTTHVRYDWQVTTTKVWMNILAPVARPVFSWNHDRVMAGGFEGLRRRLRTTAEASP